MGGATGAALGNAAKLVGALTSRPLRVIGLATPETGYATREEPRAKA